MQLRPWKSLLRVRRFYSVSDLLLLYKSHVLSYIEYRTAGLHFAGTSVFNEIDDVQSRFLRQLAVSEESAFAHFNLAPLNVRRDTSILGVIHRASLNLGPPLLWICFRAEARAPARDLRSSRRHNFQIAEWPAGRSLDIMRRSALGMIRVYNLLPDECVSVRNVSWFQSKLTELVRNRRVANDATWKVVLSCRHPILQYHPLVG